MAVANTMNPYTGELIKSYRHDDKADINTKLATLQHSFKAWRNVAVKQRVVVLRQACRYFDSNRELIAKEISAQMGKPLRQAKNEVHGFFERANFLLDNAEQVLSADIISTGISAEQDGIARRIEHSPLGTVLILAAWNYPLLIAVNGVLTALLCGNTVLLKHSSITLSIGLHFEQAFGHIPGYENLIKHLIVDHQALSEIISEAAIDHVIFTGSVAAGQSVYQHTAKQFNQCHLELGGKDGAYVAKDADPVKAAVSIVDGAMYNAGQSCCGIERVYVHEKIYSAFLAKSEELIAGYNMADPMADDCDIGPLSRPQAAVEMQTQIMDAQLKGAKIILGGKTQIIGGSTFFQPTLLTDVNHQMRVMREENFGPIMPVMKVDSDEEALALINDSRYGLTSAIYTNDDELAETFAAQAQTGTVFRNRCDYLDPALPWTGYKDSGIGSGLSQYGFFCLTRPKAINFRLKL
ncbi:aldehyde dehydrogenase family protein [Thalassotalea sp. ND16A]|uniref:aldehyde dehydrogenase family protein n=1 Tax=Thalassotalea sp. ND16A TaxID=1535422 RepID=UPI00051A24B9|nr:aldehyde dehydrogenase family protein [Thalassotalea sp. ND16A]KGJ95677.1 hypothetical protein ND16A_1212 [Thalassotalea sp. ND16A]